MIKPKVDPKAFGAFLLRHIGYGFAALILGLLIWLGLTFKSHVYDVVISSPPVDEKLIASRQERINLKLFEKITAAITEKQTRQDEPVSRDPFR